MIILVGASASGKTELAKILYLKFGYKKCITTTTRAPRHNEIDGRDYHFITQKQFHDLIEEDAFVEVTHYNQQSYGLQRKDVLDQGIVIVDPQGANTLVEKLNHLAYVVFVSSNENIRQSRMLSRGDDIDKIVQRLTIDREVFLIDKFSRLNLIIENEHEPLEKYATKIHEAYQMYLAKTK